MQLVIGDSLEKCVYEYDIEAVKNNNIVLELEKFCESIYLMYTKNDSTAGCNQFSK